MVADTVIGLIHTCQKAWQGLQTFQEIAVLEVDKMHQAITDFRFWQELLKTANGIGRANHKQGALNGFFHPIQLYGEGIRLIGCQVFQGCDGIGQLAQLGFVFNSGIIDSLGNGPDSYNIHKIIIIDFPNIHGLGPGEVQ